MAADPTLANAYKQYFDAQHQYNPESDPFYIAANLATKAAQEWNFEKKKDQERARKRGDSLQGNMDDVFMNVLDKYNPQTQQLGYEHLEVLTLKMDEAAKQGDKKLMNEIHQEAMNFANELKNGQAIMKEHADALENGTYSAGANNATLNKFLSGDPQDYETFMETNPEAPGYGKLHFRIKDANGGITVISLADMDQGNVKRADDFGTSYTSLIKNQVKEATNTGVYEFDEGETKKFINKQLANDDVMYSAFHDDIFGNGKSLAEMWKEEHPNANTDWMYIWNNQLPTDDNAVSGIVANSGYNADAMRAYTQEKLMELAEGEYDTRLDSYNKKVAADENRIKSRRNNSIQLGPNEYMSHESAKNVSDNIGARKRFTFEGNKYKPNDNPPGSWVDMEGNVYKDNESLIASMDQGRGYDIINHTLFTQHIKPKL